MATRIMNPPTNRGTPRAEGACPAAQTNDTECMQAQPVREDGCSCGNRCCTRSVEFCETMTLNGSFDAGEITEDCARIAYDPSYLGYTVEPETVQATLPCGGTCPVDVYKVGFAGAIPYIVDLGPVSSACGTPVRMSVFGNVMVEEFIGYICGSEEPELTELRCNNITPEIKVAVSDCGNSENTNITVYGTFSFSGLPSCM